MTKSFNDNSDVTAISSQVETLKKHFPQCFDKHGAFMPDKLQALVSDNGTEFSKESYSLNWLGKSYARLLANEKPLTFLSEDKTHNQKPENQNSEHLLIKGDNLEVLKHLKNAYAEQVKMIYIDPPYNTGTDGFVYQDDRKFTVDELSRLAGIDSDEAKRILDFTQSKANSHSAWLTFMYPRLYVARDLLRDDGVIFISIDDNEAAQLRILCDEVFGEENFIDPIIWKKRYGGGAKEKFLVALHEYTLVYSKSKNSLSNFFIPIEESAIKRYYKNKDENFSQRGPYRTHPLEAMKSFDERDNLNFPIPAPNGDMVWPKRQWRWAEDTATDAIKQKKIEFNQDKDGNWVLSSKQYLYNEKGEIRKTKPFSIIDDVYTQHGTNEIFQIFGNTKIFDFPKPSLFLCKLITIGLNYSTDDIILDFFAGSGTTAHAVMQLNADKGNRKFILVQIPEPCDKKKDAYKAGYKTIFDITKARIEKAAEKIKTDNPDYQGDLGFKIFETIPVPQGYLDEYETINPTAPLFNGSMLSNDQLDDLLTTWKVYDGIPLTTPLTAIDLAGYSAYQHQKMLYLIHDSFSSEALVMLLQKIDDTDKDKAFDIERLVLFAHNFDSKHQREIKEAVTKYQNKKAKNISVEFRY